MVYYVPDYIKENDFFSTIFYGELKCTLWLFLSVYMFFLMNKNVTIIAFAIVFT